MDPEKARTQYQRAVQLWKAGSYSEALDILDALTQAFPDNAQVAELRALCRTAAAKAVEPNGPRRWSRRRRTRAAVTVCAGAVFTGAVIYSTFFTTPVYREISFPETISIGTVYVRDAEEGPGGWREIGQARSRVAVPAGAVVKVRLDDLSGTNLSDAYATEQSTRAVVQEIDASGTPVDAEVLQSLFDGKALRALELRGSTIDPTVMVYLSSLAGLRRLDLSETGIGNTGAMLLEGLFALEELDLRGTYITDSGIGYLQGLTALKRFAAPGRITDAALERLGGLLTLEEIDLSYTGISDAGLRHLQGLGNVRKLVLRGTWVGDSAAAVLRALPVLEELDLSHTRITDAGLLQLARVPSLRRLVLDGTRITDNGVAQLARIPALEDLNLAACCRRPALTGPALQRLATVGSLRVLDVSGADFTDEDAAVFRQLPLERFVLVDTGVSEAAAAELKAALPQCDVRHSLRSTQRVAFIGDRSAGILWTRAAGSSQAWTRLAAARGDVDVPGGVELRLDAADPDALGNSARTMPPDLLVSVQFRPQSVVSAEVLRPFVGFPNLRELRLENVTLAPGAVEVLSELRGLRILDLSGAAVPDAELLLLGNLLLLTELDLSGVPLRPATIESIGTLTALRKLELSGAPLKETDLGPLSALGSLEELNLFDIALSAESVSNLRAALPQCAVRVSKRETTRITFPGDGAVGVLWFRDPNSPDGNWRRLGEAAGAVEVPSDAELRLEVDPGISKFQWLNSPAMDRVHELCLAGTGIDDGALASLRTTASLRALDVHGTALSNGAMVEVARMTNLRSLRLSQTAVTDEGLTSLSSLTALEELDVSNTAITDAGLALLYGLERLRRLYLEGTLVTGWGVESARQRLPGCEYFFSEADVPANVPRRTPPPAFVFKFGQGPSLGTLWIRDWTLEEGEWTLVGPLCCDVTVPANRAIKAVVSPQGVDDFERLTALPGEFVKELTLEPGAHVTNKMAAVIGSMNGLETLTLAHTRIDSGVLEHVAALPHLRRLLLHRAALNPGDLAYLRKARSLRELDLSGVPAGADVLSHLGHISLLERLEVRRNPSFSGAALTHWRGLPALRHLDLSQSSLDQQYDVYLDDLASLESLYAYESGISTETRARLAEWPLKEAIFDQIHLTALDLADISREVSGLALIDEQVTGERLASLAGASSVRDVGASSRARLWRGALSAMASTTGDLEISTALELAGIESLDELDPVAQADFRRAAFEAWARTDAGITPERMAELSGAASFRNIPREELPELQRLAARALADVKPVIDEASLAALAGATTLGELRGETRELLREAVLSEIAESGRVVTPETLAALEGATSADALDETRRMTLEAEVLSVMAKSETGITAERLAALSGTESLAALSEERQQSLQELALSAMARSDTLITSSFLAEIGGVDSFAELGAERRAALQRMALSAMAASATITEERILALAGVDSTRELSDEGLNELRALTLSAMTASETGLDPALVERFIGDAAIERLSFAHSGFSDEDFPKIPNLAGVRELDLTGCRNITDEGLVRLSLASSLESLQLGGTGIGNSALAHIGAVGTLQSLDLSDTAVSDAGLAYLTRLPRLRRLSLKGTAIEGPGLSHVARLDALESLDLSRTQVWDQPLRELAPLRELNELRLAQTSVGDDGLGAVAGIISLTELDVRSCPFVTDAGIRRLGPLLALKRLSIQSTGVTDGSIPYLRRIRGLEELTVGGTGFSPSGLIELKRTLPNCRVHVVADAPVDPAIQATMERDRAQHKEAVKAEERRRNSFENVPLWDLALRMLYVGAIVVSLLVSVVLPFAPRIAAYHPLRVSARVTALATGYVAYAVKYVSVAAFRLGQARLYDFRWWLLLLIILVLAILLSGVLGFGFEKIIEILPVPIPGVLLRGVWGH